MERGMKHRIVVLGAGYAGCYASGILARRLAPSDVEITVVNAEVDFVEKMRNHQVAAGQQLKSRSLASIFAGTGVRLRIARVTAVNPERRTVTVTDEAGHSQLGYDTLLYTLGSTADAHGVPGVAEHAHHVTTRPAALRLREKLDSLGGSGNVLVVGEGLTGIETAPELAESRPGLSVALASRGEFGGWLSPIARRHLRKVFDRLGITVHEHTGIARVEAGRAIGEGGTVLKADVTVWTAGFSVDSIAAAGGLEVAESGQILVDRTMRSVSHPDVYAAGDSVYVIGDNGRQLPMSCASCGPTATQAVNAIVGRLTDQEIPTAKLGYFGNHISLGRNDAIFQTVDGEAKAKPRAVRGRTAVLLKSSVLKGSLFGVAHPTFGMPKRKHHLAVDFGRSGERRAT